MRVTKYALLILVLIGGLATFAENADAKTVVPAPSGNHGGGHHSGSNGGHGGYYGGHHGGYYGGHHGGYYGGHYGGYYGGYRYYRPYYPYWGFGLGLGYGYGYGYPYGYYGYYGAPYYYSPYSYGSYYGYGYGEIRLEIKPKTAKVYVDGNYAGVVDDYDGWYQHLNVEPGKHRIVVRETGYVPYAETVGPLPGNNYHIKVQMQPGEDVIQEQDMRLDPKEYDYPDRQRDDQYRNRNPRPYGNQQQPDREPSPAPNDYDRNDQYQQYQNDRDRDNQYQSDRPPFILQVEPRDATVYIDGNYYGNADTDRSGEVQVLLPPGMHRVEVVRPGYESFSQDVDTGKESRLVIKLQKK